MPRLIILKTLQPLTNLKEPQLARLILPCLLPNNPTYARPNDQRTLPVAPYTSLNLSTSTDFFLWQEDLMTIFLPVGMTGGAGVTRDNLLHQ